MNAPQPYTSPSPVLQAFINKSLRVTTTDARFFIGELKCTDRVSFLLFRRIPVSQTQDRNLILVNTTEYRYPSANDGLNAAKESDGSSGKVRVDMANRFIGLVVVPGNVITKIEVQEAAARRGWRFGSGALETLKMSMMASV